MFTFPVDQVSWPMSKHRKKSLVCDRSVQSGNGTRNVSLSIEMMCGKTGVLLKLEKTETELRHWISNHSIVLKRRSGLYHIKLRGEVSLRQLAWTPQGTCWIEGPIQAKGIMSEQISKDDEAELLQKWTLPRF